MLTSLVEAVFNHTMQLFSGEKKAAVHHQFSSEQQTDAVSNQQMDIMRVSSRQKFRNIPQELTINEVKRRKY